MTTAITPHVTPPGHVNLPRARIGRDREVEAERNLDYGCLVVSNANLFLIQSFLQPVLTEPSLSISMVYLLSPDGNCISCSGNHPTMVADCPIFVSVRVIISFPLELTNKL